MRRIVLIGECMVEFAPLANGDFKLGFAGDTFNTAWYLRQLLPKDWTVQYFSNVGDDKLSHQMLASMADSGIDTTHVKVVRGQSVGLYVISLDQGERSFSYWRNTSAARTLADDATRLSDATQDVNCVFFSGITLAILPEKARESFLQHMEKLRSNGALVVFDSNIRKRLWTSDDEIRHWIKRAYAVADVALPSFADEAELFGDADLVGTAERIREAGADEVIVKNGGDACFFQTATTSGSVLPHKSSTVVDTTGAGDSFNASYTASKLMGATPHTSVQNANALAAKVIAKYGALVPVA